MGERCTFSRISRSVSGVVVAEGVENVEIVDELRRLGEFKAQGYLYGKPASGPEIHDRLANMGMLRESMMTAAIAESAEQARQAGAA